MFEIAISAELALFFQNTENLRLVAISAELALLLFVDLEFLKDYNCNFGVKSSKNRKFACKYSFGGNGGKSTKIFGNCNFGGDW
jgi:hypothetical protein